MNQLSNESLLEIFKLFHDYSKSLFSCIKIIVPILWANPNFNKEVIEAYLTRLNKDEQKLLLPFNTYSNINYIKIIDMGSLIFNVRTWLHNNEKISENNQIANLITTN